MRCRSLIVVVALLCSGAIRAAAQEAHPPQATDPGRPTHGIIRKPQPRPPADPAKPATATEAGNHEATKAESGKAPEPHVKAASTEAVAAAIANAVRSLEEKEKRKPEAAHVQPARVARPAAPRAVPQRRYSVKWPTQRFEVEWAAPVDRVVLSWGALETTAEYSRDDRQLEP
jgi:hypothetical protein